MSKGINATKAAEQFLTIGEDKVLEEARARGLETDDAKLAAQLIALDTRSLQEYGAVLYNLTAGKITGKELGPMMAAAFPGHDMSKGRHGNHYIAKVRAGDSGRVVIRAPLPERKARVVEVSTAEVPISDIPEKTLDAVIARLDGSKLGEMLVKARAASKAKPAPAPETAPTIEPAKEPEPIVAAAVALADAIVDAAKGTETVPTPEAKPRKGNKRSSALEDQPSVAE